MGTQRAHYVLPEALISEIKEIAGPRGSSALVAEILSAEFRKRRLLAFLDKLKKDGPAWKDEDHPDLVELGTPGWVRKIRKENGQRLNRAEKARAKR